MRNPNQSHEIPLVRDLDGTLSRTDTTLELLLLYLKAQPVLGWLHVLLWVRAGRARMKENLFAAVGGELDLARLPYSRAFLCSDLFQESGHRVLVSGAAQPVVEGVVQQVGGFAEAVGSRDGRNLTGHSKAAYLVSRYPGGFDYVGNSRDDLAVWAKARRAFAVNAPTSVLAAAAARGIALDTVVIRDSQLRPLLQGLRLHQWVKNALIFVVPALNLALLTPVLLLKLVALFLAFGLVASATYLFNDLLDIQEDRKHHSKCARPFASGRLDIVPGVLAIAGCFTAGIALALLTDPLLAGMLLIYATISLAYSFKLKRLVILDAMTLAGLFCWRILVGTVALGVEINVWFMTAVGAFFLSLAFGKRCIELERKAALSISIGAAQASEAAAGAGEATTGLAAQSEQLHGRGYQIRDFPVVLGLGLVTGMAAPLVVLIYIYLSGSSLVNHTPSALSLAGLLAYWIARFWVLVNRGQVQDDPIVFALKDRNSLGLLAVIASILVLEQIN